MTNTTGFQSDPAPHPDPEDSIACALHELRTFYRRNFVAAYELDDGRNLDALAHACDVVREKLDALLGQLEVDADGVPTERINETRYEDAL